MSVLPQPPFMSVRTPGYKCQSSTLTGSSKRSVLAYEVITVWKWLGLSILGLWGRELSLQHICFAFLSQLHSQQGPPMQD